ncbi:hypothetical protein J3Q64DRAFT_1707124 [Phycomyces blakesleeanus]|uniref:Mid2 domain-containing protein n=2 Tax=Phycomyces blakesleeanus TaxID=4837 RepID=A0A167PB04_PHYB8|nr:hypothetical protein PHYBLDRAFT_141471 [Phycomyces blakesleeanus NRRL 1555(-)]OAD77594.1 hypothetical protein PHYBLDRAFT_141471 [Phycomyces blakesleeanus NRRL 1555(-)]|eukprot:XP_018295634.1 hypothetical protein PHYBLDRAFT_141471 [Phycomyces blakesleeanus NRRL 1555(-)]
MRFLFLTLCLLLHPTAILSLAPAIPGDSVLIPEPSSFIPSRTSTFNTPTITNSPQTFDPPPQFHEDEEPHERHGRDEQDKREERDEKDNKSSQTEDERKKESSDKRVRSSALHATTNTHGKTVIVTTIIIVSNPDPDQVFRAMGDGDDKTKQSGDQSSSTMTDPNSSNSDGQNSSGEALGNGYQRKKNEVRRMVTIASLVGGLGGVSVIAAAIILTRVRIRKRRDMAAKNIHADDSDDDNDSSNDNEFDLPLDIENGGSSPQVREIQTSDNDHTNRNVSQDRSPPEPSAPPAPLSPSLGNVQGVVYEPCPPRRTMSMQLQSSSPLPSAPTIKELDGLANDYHRMPPLFQIQASSSHTNHSDSSHPSSSTASSACPHCKPVELLVPPEVPPPAYTPSAPPLYTIPPANAGQGSSSSCPSSPQNSDTCGS